MNHLISLYLRQWGTYAFARYCFNLGIEFEDAYFMIFGKEPRQWN